MAKPKVNTCDALNAEEFFSIAKVPKLIPSALAVITLLLIATPVGSRITALLDFNKQMTTMPNN